MMTLTSIRVLCVDDNQHVGSAIRSKIERSKGYEWIGQLNSADHLVEEAAGTQPDVVLLDVDMPGLDPFIALEELSARCPDMRIVMLSGHSSRALVDRAIDAGAWGYFSKDDDFASMLQTIQDATQGQFELGPSVSAMLRSAARD